MTQNATTLVSNWSKFVKANNLVDLQHNVVEEEGKQRLKTIVATHSIKANFTSEGAIEDALNDYQLRLVYPEPPDKGLSPFTIEALE